MCLGGALREWFLTERDEVAQLIDSGKQAGRGAGAGGVPGTVRHRRSSAASVNRKENGGGDLAAQKVQTNCSPRYTMVTLQV